MSCIEKQVGILNELSGLIHQSAGLNYDSASCKFEINIEDESVGQEFLFTKGDQEVSALLEDPEWIIMDLVFDLYKEMKAHTGGEWISFTLTIGEDGKATTKFEYTE